MRKRSRLSGSASGRHRAGTAAAQTTGRGMVPGESPERALVGRMKHPAPLESATEGV
jgi:hypothetical protein